MADSQIKKFLSVLMVCFGHLQRGIQASFLIMCLNVLSILRNAPAIFFSPRWHSFVLRFKVAFDFPTSIWQKKNPTTYGNWSILVFWNPDQITQPRIDLNTWKKRNWSKDFKKVGPIRGNPSLSCNKCCFDSISSKKITDFFSVKLMLENQMQLWTSE